MASAWVQKLNTTIASAPAGVNPYSFVEQKMPYHVVVTGDANQTAFVANMGLIIGIYVFAFFTALFTLYMKAKSGSLWLFRMRSTLHGSIIVPNTMSLFTVWCALFTAWSAIYIGFLIAAIKRQMTSIPAQAVMSLIWQPMVLSLFSEGFGMVVALYLSKPEHFIFGKPIHANWINIPAMAFYVITPAALIPYFALATYKTNMYLHAHRDFYSWLSAQAASWDGSSAFEWTSEGYGYVQTMMDDFAHFFTYLGNGFKVFFILILIAAFFFGPAAVGYLGLLRRQMQLRNRMSNSVSGSTLKHSGVSSTPSSRSSERLESLTESYRLMVIETVLALFVTFAYLVLNGWAGWFMGSIIGSPSAVIWQHALFYWIFAALGTPVTCLIAYRSWKTYTNESSSRSTLVGHDSRSDKFHKIAISTETSTFVNHIDAPRTVHLSKLSTSNSDDTFAKDRSFLDFDGPSKV